MRRFRSNPNPDLAQHNRTLKEIHRSLRLNVADHDSPKGHCFSPKPTGDSFPRPALQISGPALATMHWAARHSHNVCCLWGLLELMPDGPLRLAEAFLAKQSVTPARCRPDMAWYGDLLAAMHEQRGIEPWRLACWIHTRPMGLSAPSLLSRNTFETSFGRHRLAMMLIVTPDRRLHGEVSSILSPLPRTAPMRLCSPLRLILEEPATRLTATQRKSQERQFQERVSIVRDPGVAQPWPWDAPLELWPEADPDLYGHSPYLPHDWLKAWRRVQCELPARELEAYLRGFLWRVGPGREQLSPDAFDLDLIALHFDDELMSIWAASLLRERLRAVARRRGWLP